MTGGQVSTLGVSAMRTLVHLRLAACVLGGPAEKLRQGIICGELMRELISDPAHSRRETLPVINFPRERLGSTG